MSSSYQKTTRDTIIIGVTTFLTSLIGLVQLTLLTKTLGAQGYGIWAQVWVTISLVLPLFSFGLGGSLIRFLAAEKNKEEIQEQFYSVASVLFIVHLIIALAVIAFASPLATNFFDGAVQIVRITGILILLSSLNGLYLSLIRTFQQIKKYSIFVMTENCSQVVLIACLVLTGHGVLSVILSVLVIKLIIFLVLFFSISSQIGIKRPHFSRLKEYLSFGLPLVPGGIAFWLVNLSDRYVIGFFLGATSVGIYSAGYGIGNFPYIVIAVLTFVLFATLSQLYDEGRMNEVKTHLSYSLKYFLAIIIPFIFGAAILAEPVLRLFTTPEIASQGRFVVPLVALAVSLLGIYNIIFHILILTKKMKVMVPVWIVAALLNIGLNIVVVPRIGIIGAAITTLIAYSLALGIVSYYSCKEFRFSVGWHFIIKSVIASGVMSLVVWLMSPQDNLVTIITVLAGVGVYVAVILLLRGFTREEFSFFRGLLRRSTSTANLNSDKAK